MRSKKIIILGSIVLLVIFLIAAYVYTEFNRKVTDTKDREAAYIVTTRDLINEFEKDSKNSNTKYLNQVVEIDGNIKSVEDQSGYTIVLGDSSSSTSIRCIMDSGFKPAFTLKIGQKFHVKGIYTGFNADDLGIGSDIIINKSVIKP